MTCQLSPTWVALHDTVYSSTVGVSPARTTNLQSDPSSTSSPPPSPPSPQPFSHAPQECGQIFLYPDYFSQWRPYAWEGVWTAAAAAAATARLSRDTAKFVFGNLMFAQGELLVQLPLHLLQAVVGNQQLAEVIEGWLALLPRLDGKDMSVPE